MESRCANERLCQVLAQLVPLEEIEAPMLRVERKLRRRGQSESGQAPVKGWEKWRRDAVNFPTIDAKRRPLLPNQDLP